MSSAREPAANTGPVVVMLPAYNEEETLPPLLDRYAALDLDFTMVVVDDGSTDRTVEKIEPYKSKMKLEVVPHGVNRGLGCAMQTGMKRAAEIAGPDGIVVSMDADNSHPPEIIAGMLDEMRAGADVVIASRYRKGAVIKGVPGYRQFLSWGTFFLMKLLVPVEGVRDYSCGFRAYRGQILQRAIARYGQSFIEAQGFQVQLEILLKLDKIGARFAEVPIELRYDLKLSDSKIKIFKTIRNYFKVVADSKRIPRQTGGAN